MDEHLDYAILQRLEGADGNAELLARLGVLDGRLQQSLERADCLGGDGGDAHVVDGEERIERGAFLPHQGFASYEYVLQDDIRGAAPVERSVRLQRDALRVPRDEEDRDAAVGLRRDEEQVGGGRVKDHRFLAAQGEAVAAPRRAGRYLREIVPRTRLAVREHHDPLASRHRREQLSLLRGGSQIAQQSRRHHRAREIRLEQEAAPDPVHGEHRLDGRAAHAAVLLGDGKREQAHLGEAAPHFAAHPFFRAEDALALLESVFAGDEALDGVAELLLFLGEVEVHG